MTGRPVSRLALPAFFAVLTGACAPLQDFFLPSPRAPAAWEAFVDQVRAFERRIGFEETANFVEFSEERVSYPFCGHTSRLTLPYSYQDPAIRWHDAATEADCGKLAQGADVYFGRVEAKGEIGTPVTPAMIKSKLDRFLYLVIHEDCHDQFDLPYGIEEALCNLITYKAMARLSDEKFGSSAREDRALHRYASVESERTRATIVHYDQLSTLYARYERNEIAEDALMRERAVILGKAARALTSSPALNLIWNRRPLNNVGLASDMTYSRHYPFLEGVFDALGSDLARTVAFFRRVDRLKLSPAEVMERHGIVTEESVEFIRAYEAAVVETIRKALADAARR